MNLRKHLLKIGLWYLSDMFSYLLLVIIKYIDVIYLYLIKNNPEQLI